MYKPMVLKTLDIRQWKNDSWEVRNKHNKPYIAPAYCLERVSEEDANQAELGRLSGVEDSAWEFRGTMAGRLVGQSAKNPRYLQRLFVKFSGKYWSALAHEETTWGREENLIELEGTVLGIHTGPGIFPSARMANFTNHGALDTVLSWASLVGKN